MVDQGYALKIGLHLLHLLKSVAKHPLNFQCPKTAQQSSSGLLEETVYITEALPFYCVHFLGVFGADELIHVAFMLCFKYGQVKWCSSCHF